MLPKKQSRVKKLPARTAASSKEQVQVEQSLQEVQHRFRQIIEYNADLFYYFQPNDGTISYLSPQSIRFFDAEPKQAIAKWDYFFAHNPDNAHKREYAHKLLLAGKIPPSYELEVHTIKNRIVWVEVNEMPVVMHKKTVAAIGTLKDITARKKTEEALLRYHLLADYAHDIIYFSTIEGNILEANKAAVEAYGYSYNELLRMNVRDIRSIETVHGIEDQLRQAATDGLILETIQRRKDGTVFPVEISARGVKIDNKRIVASVVRDITQRKRAEEALRQTQKMESLGVLAGGIAHDFNNLLQAIIGQTYLALTKLPETLEVRKNIERAQLAATRAADLTRQLLAYSGHGKFLVKVIELNTFIQENLHLLEIAIPKNAELHVETIEPKLYFNADVAQLQQVLVNLVINAAEAMNGNAGTITIRAYRQNIDEKNLPSWKRGNVTPKPGTFIVLGVEDTGQGMDQSTAEKIFDPFFTTKFTGRGLGLAAVLGIIHGHDGGLQVESQFHAGTKFRIAFPQTLPPQSVPEEIVPETKNQLHGTILFIDDESCVREAFVDAFAQSNIKVLTAKDGEEGIAMFKEHQDLISLILLDLSMPGMGGEAAFRALRNISPHVKIIISSGYSEEDITTKFKGLEITGLILKPYPWNKLHQLLTEYLNILTL